MALAINDTAPDFEAETTQGKIKFHDWIGDSWAVLFSHPKDFTPICTTELGYMARIEPEFAKRGVKIIGLSVDATGDREVRVGDHRVVGRVPLCLLDVLRPALVLVEGVDGEADDLHPAAVELTLHLGHVAELGGADRREVLRMREQDSPRVT